MEKRILFFTIIIFYTTLLQTSARQRIETSIADGSLTLTVNRPDHGIPPEVERYEPIPLSIFLKDLVCKKTRYACILVKSFNLPGGYQQLNITVHEKKDDLGTSYRYERTPCNSTIPANPHLSLFALCTFSNTLLQFNRNNHTHAAYLISEQIGQSTNLSDEEKIHLSKILHAIRSGEIRLTNQPDSHLVVKYFDNPTQ